jgi:hypothetical protein
MLNCLEMIEARRRPDRWIELAFVALTLLVAVATLLGIAR